jgi:hypothetical protein
LVSAFFTGTTWAELEPARIGIDCCRSGIMRTVATGTWGVDLAFTAVLAMLIHSNRGLLRLFWWRIPVWIGTDLRGIRLQHIPG